MLTAYSKSTPSAVPIKRTRNGSSPRKLRGTTWAAIGFVLPLLVYLIVFYISPLWQNLSMSFHLFSRRTFITGEAPFVGFQVYKEVISDPLFWPTVLQTFTFTILSIAFQYWIGLLLAVYFKQNFKLNGFLRAAFLIPWLLPPMVSGTIWQWMMNADNGIFNKFLGVLGIAPIWWLQADHSLWSVIIANIWLGIPFNLVILYSGLQNINEDLYEAASIDGANAWQRFWKITFPLLRPVTLITLLLGFIYTLKVVDIIWLMTMGSGTSQTLATWSYAMAFGKGTSTTIRYSQASVVGTLLILVALIFAFVYLWLQGKEEKN